MAPGLLRAGLAIIAHGPALKCRLPNTYRRLAAVDPGRQEPWKARRLTTATLGLTAEAIARFMPAHEGETAAPRTDGLAVGAGGEPSQRDRRVGLSRTDSPCVGQMPLSALAAERAATRWYAGSAELRQLLVVDEHAAEQVADLGDPLGDGRGSSTGRAGGRGRRARPSAIGSDTGAPAPGAALYGATERLVDRVLGVVEAGPPVALATSPTSS